MPRGWLYRHHQAFGRVPKDRISLPRIEGTTKLKPFEEVNAFVSIADPEEFAAGGFLRPAPRDSADDLPLPATAEQDGLSRASGGVIGHDRHFAVKDNIVTRDYRTTCGSKFLQDYISPFDATVVKAFFRGVRGLGGEKHGRFNMGKTNLDEFGMGSHSMNSFFGPVVGLTPLRERSVGGSSGGSAMAIASGRCSYALGTDTGGSVRLPAAYTGIVGFKPSYGRISRWGVVPYANSLDTVGVLGHSVPAILSALPAEIMHSDPQDPTSLKSTSWQRMYDARRSQAISLGRKPHITGDFLDPVYYHLQNDFRNLKIGIPVEYNIAELDSHVKDEWRSVLKLFQDHGCTLVPVSLPNTKHALSAYYVIAAAEAASNLAKYDGVRYGTRLNSSDGEGDVLFSNTRGEGFGDEVKRRILLGSYSLSSKAIDNYFIKAQKVRRLVQRDFDRVFSLPNLLRDEEQFDLGDMDEAVQMENKLGPPQVDFIVCPTAPTPPPTREDVEKSSTVNSYIADVFTVPSSLAGLPAISIPCKLPGGRGFAGIQIIGQYSDDQRLLVVADAVRRLQKRNAPLMKENPGGKLQELEYSFSPLSDKRLQQTATKQEIDQFMEVPYKDWDDMISGIK